MDEKKENKVSKAFFDNKFSKYGVTKKTFYSMGGMLVCIMLIIILSVTGATFDKEQIKNISFWIEFAILAGLCIYGMILGQQTGDDMARNNPDGAFRVSLKKFGVVFNKIDSLMLFAYFDSWLESFRQRKIRKKIESILKDNGIHQMEVLDLDLNDLDLLASPFKKVWPDGKITYFLTYNREQIELIKYCMEGRVKVSKLPRTFFVNALYQSGKDMWESAAKSGKKKSAYLSLNYLYRIAILLSMCILSAGLSPGTYENGQAAVWLSLGKRIFCVISAFVWGIFVGFEIVKIDISYLDFKTDILNNYYQECELKIYIPKNLEEKAKEIYEDQKEVTDDGTKEGKENESNNILD